jgi:hypothetical protein
VTTRHDATDDHLKITARAWRGVWHGRCCRGRPRSELQESGAAINASRPAIRRPARRGRVACCGECGLACPAQCVHQMQLPLDSGRSRPRRCCRSRCCSPHRGAGHNLAAKACHLVRTHLRLYPQCRRRRPIQESNDTHVTARYSPTPTSTDADAVRAAAWPGPFPPPACEPSAADEPLSKPSACEPSPLSGAALGAAGVRSSLR